MSSFNLSDYENVKSRKKRFYDTYPDGRIIPELVSPETITEYALFKAAVYKNREDASDKLPIGIGYAFEIRDKELSVASSGKKYESVNYTSWTENAEESAVGRALDNAGFASNMRCSKEEIEKVERQKAVINKQNEKIKMLDEIKSAFKKKYPDVENQKEYLETVSGYKWEDFSKLGHKDLEEFLKLIATEPKVRPAATKPSFKIGE